MTEFERLVLRLLMSLVGYHMARSGQQERQALAEGEAAVREARAATSAPH